VASPGIPHPLIGQNDIILDCRGISLLADTGDSSPPGQSVRLCGGCHSHLIRGRTPPLSLANMMFIGEQPPELKGLRLMEESMIALSRGMCSIVQLRERSTDIGHASTFNTPNIQKGFRGHVIVFPQHPQVVADVLPPSIDEITSPMCVVFVGDKPPTREWLIEKAKPLAVRGNVVRRALLWLKENNYLYRDITVNHGLLDTLVPEVLLPVHIEHVQPTRQTDDPVSGFNERPVADDMQHNEYPFESVLISDIGLQASPNDMHAAALQHLRKPSAGFVQLSRGSLSEAEFGNHELFPRMFPTLFPYGLGGVENPNRRLRVSFQKHISHLLSLKDDRFQKHHAFQFIAFNIMQRREVLWSSHVRVT